MPTTNSTSTVPTIAAIPVSNDRHDGNNNDPELAQATVLSSSHMMSTRSLDPVLPLASPAEILAVAEAETAPRGEDSIPTAMAAPVAPRPPRTNTNIRAQTNTRGELYITLGDGRRVRVANSSTNNNNNNNNNNRNNNNSNGYITLRNGQRVHYSFALFFVIFIFIFVIAFAAIFEEGSEEHHPATYSYGGTDADSYYNPSPYDHSNDDNDFSDLWEDLIPSWDSSNNWFAPAPSVAPSISSASASPTTFLDSAPPPMISESESPSQAPTTVKQRAN